jgi:hypothetical protein
LAKEPSPVISPVDNIDNTKSNEVEVTVNYQYEDFQKTHNCSVCFVWKGIRLGEPNSLGWIVEKLGDGFSLGDIWYTFKLDDKSNTSGETYASGSGISTEISSNYKDCKYSYDFEYEFDLIDSSDSENFDSDSEGNATINVKVNGIFNSSTIPFDMQCLNHVNNFICAFNASKGNEDYKPLHRFLNSMDINVLKVIYSFFANQVMTNYMTRISGTVYLSVNKLYYLCLPLNYDDDNNSGNMYADKSVAKFKSIKNVKEAMIGMMNIDNIFKNPEFCYNKYFKDFVSQRIRQLDQLRGCLRKLAYLHLICLIDDPKASGYGCMCIAPTVLDIDSANLSASFWYDMGYTSRFICYDEYLEARGLDYLKLVVSRKSKNDNPYLEDSIREFVGDAKYCPLSQFPKNCRDFIEIRLKHIFGEQYQIMKIKNNAMLGRFEELGISGEGIKVGVKILLHRDYVPEINLLEFLD